MVQHRQHLKLAPFSSLRAMHLEKGKRGFLSLKLRAVSISLTESSSRMCVTDMRSFKCLSALSFTNWIKIPKWYSTVAEHVSGKTKVFSNCHSCPMLPNLSPLFSKSKLSITPVWETETRTSEACLVYQIHLNRPSVQERVQDCGHPPTLLASLISCDSCLKKYPRNSKQHFLVPQCIYRFSENLKKGADPFPQETYKCINKTWQELHGGHGPQEVNGSQLSVLIWWKEKDRFNWPSFPSPLYLGWVSSSTECEASRGMHMEHWGREGTPAQSDKSAK